MVKHGVAVFDDSVRNKNNTEKAKRERNREKETNRPCRNYKKEIDLLEEVFGTVGLGRRDVGG